MLRFLRLGTLAGLVAGLAFAGFLLTVGQGPIDEAVAIEEAAAADDGHAHDHGDEAPFDAGQQRVGGALGGLVLGAALGAVFGIVLAATRHLLPGGDDLRRCLWLAGAAYVSVVLVPALRYPPNPPAVGDPATVGQRSLLYLLLVAASVLLTVLAARSALWLRRRGASDAVRLLAPTALWLVGVIVLLLAFPTPGGAVDLPADLVWRFRLASLGSTLTLWMTLGAALGVLLLPPASRRLALGRRSSDAATTV